MSDVASEMQSPRSLNLFSDAAESDMSESEYESQTEQLSGDPTPWSITHPVKHGLPAVQRSSDLLEGSWRGGAAYQRVTPGHVHEADYIYRRQKNEIKPAHGLWRHQGWEKNN